MKVGKTTFLSFPRRFKNVRISGDPDGAAATVKSNAVLSGDALSSS